MKNNSKPVLVIFYDHFYPAYKAGGPIQSLINLIQIMHVEYKIFVFTSAFDLNESTMLKGIQTDVWDKIKLPLIDEEISVWYAGKGKMLKTDVQKSIRMADPDFIYLNGMFSYRFVLIPLLCIKKIKIVICPRGMLQKGALAGKKIKKKIYLNFLKISGLCKKVIWHATNEEEGNDIKKYFGKNATIVTVGNIPKKPVNEVKYKLKNVGEVNLIYLSLISEKKNLLQVIDIISKLNEQISLDIYGPIKDKIYWEKCQKLINKSNGKVVFKGDVVSEKVQELFSKYHALILLTKGENFGHALYECLSVGRPIITSYFTPWNDLINKKAGWNVDISNTESIERTLISLKNMEQSSYDLFCNGAYLLANEYFNNGFDILNYKKIFVK